SLELLPEDSLPQQIQNIGSAPVAAQWKRHNRFLATDVPEKTPMLLTPAQHLDAERTFYKDYVNALLEQNILQQSDTQTVRFTRSGARSFHVGLTSRSAKRPKPTGTEWIGARGKLPLKKPITVRNLALVASAGVGIAIVGHLMQSRDITPDITPDVVTSQPAATSDTITPADTLAGDPSNSQAQNNHDPVATNDTADEQQGSSTPVDRQRYMIADQEDEMWRIAVENAEFFLLSNDGDPAPWIRTARKIAAGFNSGDSRLARTYFLSALLEQDYRIAEQQFNRALSIQTKTLGLYHAETAQTLEALAWVAEHNKDDLEEAITHQRLAINIYHDIFGPEAEDTKAAEWKLGYFEDRLAGIRPKAESNRRLLPALARFSR
ncbi:MAG: tetratricopeptide repeat protein, partial [Pseudomonadota bacterium]